MNLSFVENLVGLRVYPSGAVEKWISFLHLKQMYFSLMKLNSVQETATVYPIVVIRKVEDDNREDHIVFISNDKKHDVPFVEYCSDILHRYYKDAGLPITYDIEYDDGCGLQFNCIRAFSSLTIRKVKTTRVFCETMAMAVQSQMVLGVLLSRMHHVLSVESEKSLGMQRSFLISLMKILL